MLSFTVCTDTGRRNFAPSFEAAGSAALAKAIIVATLQSRLMQEDADWRLSQAPSRYWSRNISETSPIRVLARLNLEQRSLRGSNVTKNNWLSWLSPRISSNPYLNVQKVAASFGFQRSLRGPVRGQMSAANVAASLNPPSATFCDWRQSRHRECLSYTADSPFCRSHQTGSTVDLVHQSSFF